MEKLKYIKIEHEDGTLSENVPVGADAANIDVTNDKDLATKLNELDAKDTNIETDYKNADAGLRKDVDANKTTITGCRTDINTLTSRVNNLSTLEEGSTTGDAELIDARVNSDGAIYSSLGNHIRDFEEKYLENVTDTLIKMEANGFWRPSGQWISQQSFNGYQLITEPDCYYYIRATSFGEAANIVSQNMIGTHNSAVNYSHYILPHTLNNTSYDIYPTGYWVRGNGASIYINHCFQDPIYPLYVGKISIHNEWDFMEIENWHEYEGDIASTDNKIIQYSGSIVDIDADWVLYSFIPTKGKVYKIHTLAGGAAPHIWQSVTNRVPNTNIDGSHLLWKNFNSIFIPEYDNTPVYINYLRGKMESPLVILESNFNIPYTENVDPTEKFTENNTLQGSVDKLICIGDSLTYGSTCTAPTDVAGYYYENYYNMPYFLSKRLGVNSVTKYAIPGAAATLMWNTYKDSITEDNALYIVWLGTNGGLTDTVATDCSGDDYIQFSNNNVGNLGKILGKIKSFTNNKIILVNTFIMAGGDVTTTNKAIADLATKFDCLLVNLVDTDVNNEKYHTAWNGYYEAVHFNNAGYSYVAELIYNTINEYMNENKTFLNFYKVAETAE